MTAPDDFQEPPEPDSDWLLFWDWLTPARMRRYSLWMESDSERTKRLLVEIQDL